MNEGARYANEAAFQNRLLALLEKILEEVQLMDSRLLTLEEVAEETRAIRAARV